MNALLPQRGWCRGFPHFTEKYPEWVWRYYLSTGDIDTLASLQTTVQNISDYLQNAVDPATGLITGLALGSNGDPIYGYDLDTVADGTINVMGVNAFNRIGQIAGALGDAGERPMQGRAHASLRAAVNSAGARRRHLRGRSPRRRIN